MARRRTVARPDSLCWVAEQALELRAEVLGTAFGGRDPEPDLPGRIVSNVLGVPALELGDPMSFLVLMVTNNRPLHFSAREARRSNYAGHGEPCTAEGRRARQNGAGHDFRRFVYGFSA
jgi:hypothetical protein